MSHTAPSEETVWKMHRWQAQVHYRTSTGIPCVMGYGSVKTAVEACERRQNSPNINSTTIALGAVVIDANGTQICTWGEPPEMEDQ